MHEDKEERKWIGEGWERPEGETRDGHSIDTKKNCNE